MASLNQQFLYSILIIAIGYILKRSHIIKEKDGEGLARIIFNITLPGLIIVTFSDIVFESSLLLLIIAGVVYGLVSGFIGLWVFRNQGRYNKGMLGMMVPGFNIGLFAYPLVDGIWGQEGLKYFGMFDVGNAFIVFGFSYLIGSYYSGEQVKLNFRMVAGKLSKSLPLLTYIIICALNISGLKLPGLVLEVSDIISKANMPLSLLLLGIYLNFTFEKGYGKYIVKFLLTKYGLGLIVGLALFFLLPFEDMFRYTLLIGLILPTAVSVLPYSVEFGYDQKFVGTVSNMTIIISFLLVWAITNIIL
ncbi:AEC family transporter [Aquibacillus kalidii]|uniref:AEC family transporter n=1 Tax=Aquibacillus kalidii TaxID=2762597 RepID=UPI001644E7D1|nr:AEC family transporter [Aquibacillus kalidii]